MDSADLEIEPAHLILVGVGAGAVVAWLLLFSVKFARMSRDSKGEIAMIKWWVVVLMRTYYRPFLLPTTSFLPCSLVHPRTLQQLAKFAIGAAKSCVCVLLFSWWRKFPCYQWQWAKQIRSEKRPSSMEYHGKSSTIRQHFCFVRWLAYVYIGLWLCSFVSPRASS